MNRSKKKIRLRYHQFRLWIPFGESKWGIVIARFIIALVMAGFALFLVGTVTGAVAVAVKDIITAVATLVALALIATAIVLLRPLYKKLNKLDHYEQGTRQRVKSELEQYQRELRRHGNSPETVDRRLHHHEKPHLGADGEMVFDKPFREGHGKPPEHHKLGT